jgi:hypothetical protein
MSTSVYLLIVGLVLVIVGLVIRFAPLVSGRWRLAAIVIVPFGTAPRSWLPWGLASLSLGFASLVTPSVATAVLLILSVVLFVVGVLFAFWAPDWMQPRSLRTSSRADRSE